MVVDFLEIVVMSLVHHMQEEKPRVDHQLVKQHQRFHLHSRHQWGTDLRGMRLTRGIETIEKHRCTIHPSTVYVVVKVVAVRLVISVAVHQDVVVIVSVYQKAMTVIRHHVHHSLGSTVLAVRHLDLVVMRKMVS
tara:strand:- start:1733 stop:2137 length:405 start_codon:yes stop_codon:yes gene_type:complete